MSTDCRDVGKEGAWGGSCYNKSGKNDGGLGRVTAVVSTQVFGMFQSRNK